MTTPGGCSLTRVITLHARHRYTHGAPAGDHGHLYRIEVTVRPLASGTRGTIIDLDVFDTVLAAQLSARVAGQHLNDAVPEFASGEQPPSCEAFAAWCWRQVAPHLPVDVCLERIRVAEDATLWADCTGVG